MLTGRAGGGPGRFPAGLLSLGCGFISQARSGPTCLENVLRIPFYSSPTLRGRKYMLS